MTAINPTTVGQVREALAQFNNEDEVLFGSYHDRAFLDAKSGDKWLEVLSE